MSLLSGDGGLEWWWWWLVVVVVVVVAQSGSGDGTVTSGQPKTISFTPPLQIPRVYLTQTEDWYPWEVSIYVYFILYAIQMGCYS